jgi:hypothetical protein
VNRRGHQGRVDANHVEIVRALRRHGIAVLSLAPMGRGVPDLLCAFRDVTCLIEIKDEARPPSARALTAQQERFIGSWPGKVFVVNSPDEAVRVVVELARP